MFICSHENSRRLVRGIVALACGLCVSCAWCKLGRLRREHAGKQRADLFMDGMVETVAVIKDIRAERIYGPPHDFSPYLFQHMTEMLYPIEYVSAGADGALNAGSLVILLPNIKINASGRIIASNGVFRLARIEP